MNHKPYLKLYSCCLFSRGAGRSAIYDLQRGRIFLVPNSLPDLFAASTHAFHTEEVRNALDEENRRVLNGYIALLEDNELAFRCSEEELGRFPPLSSEYLYPAHISHCIMDAGSSIPYLDTDLLRQLEKLGCNHIQVRFFGNLSLHTLRDITSLLNPSQIQSVELLLSYIATEYFEEDIRRFVGQNRKVRSVIVYNAPQSYILQESNMSAGLVYMTRERISSALHCGIVQPEQFALNIPHYTESLHHNTCLNRKIAIDAEGNIKNCPSMKESFGNIRDTTLEEAIHKPGFKKYWNIKKDEIIKCRDCEFRHVCTDCRAYLDNPDDIYSAPLKCGYDPYTCTWEEWSTHPMKQKAIDYYGMRGAEGPVIF